MELTDYPTKVIHGLDRPPSYCPLDQMLKDGQERSKEIYEKRIGGDIFITLSPLRDTDGLIVGAVHVARDITDRKRAEKALQESENKFRTLAEKSLIGI
ncbi:MAG: PAS domain S-box protein, partial [Patescibacteria group bacterium]